MPTYSYRCVGCGFGRDVFQTIGEYMRAPLVPGCEGCGQSMQRWITTTAPVMVSEAHYTDLRALDGTDISSRAKHRQYMRERGLTTMDDYTHEWQRAAKDRAQVLQGTDAERKRDIAEAIHKLESKHGN